MILSSSRSRVLALSFVALASCQQSVAPPPPPAPPIVVVAMPIQRPVVNYKFYTGRTAAVESAEIRARVPGFLDGMHFTVADELEADAKLFTIEPDVYEARVDQMKAALASAEADLSRAQSDLNRVEQAVETNAVSRQEVEKRKSERDMAKASVLEAQANLKQAELDLGYCTITTPIAGKVSRNLVDVGNLVGSGDNTLLATVAKMDPIHVYFEASEHDVITWLDSHDTTVEDRDVEIPAHLGLSRGEDFPFEGLIDYVDNQVNSGTGTIVLRASFSNKERKLFPGLFARIRVPFSVDEQAVIVKEQAIGTDLGGKYVLTVGDDNMVTLKHVVLGALEGDERAILSGLEPDDRYIVDGHMRARPGRPCTPKEAPSEDPAGTSAKQG